MPAAEQGCARGLPRAEPSGGVGAAALACGGTRWRRCSSRGGAWRQQGWAAQCSGRFAGLGARGDGEQAHAGAARGVRRRRSRASAAALRLRRCGIQAGMGLERERRARRSSPATRLERREAGKWNSTRGAELDGAVNGGRGLQLRFRPAEGSIEHEMERRRCRARLRGLQREESRHGGERWPESAPARRAAARVRLSCVLCARARKGEREGESELGIPLSNVGA